MIETPIVGDLVLVRRGEVFVADRVVANAQGQLELSLLGYKLDDLISLGATIRVLEQAPGRLPREAGLYQDNTANLDVWRLVTDPAPARLVRIRDGMSITAIPQGYAVKRLLTLAEAGQVMVDYFTEVSWPETAARIREQFID